MPRRFENELWTVRTNDSLTLCPVHAFGSDLNFSVNVPFTSRVKGSSADPGDRNQSSY